MNTSLVLLALLAADPQRTIYRPSSAFDASVAEDHAAPLVVRAQGSPFFGGGGSTPPTYSPPAGSFGQGTSDPFAQPSYGQPSYGQPSYGQPSGDPFMGGGTTPAPYGYDPFAAQAPSAYTFGLNGPQPFQYGWQSRYDFGLMPSEGTSGPNVGSFKIFEADFEKELNSPIGGGYTFSLAPQFNYRSWEGPRGIAGGNAGLPGDAYRFGLGLKLATPVYGAWQFEVGFNPSVGTDFSDVSSDAIMFDGHLAAFYRTSPQLMYAIGAAYWDRVDDILLPYAGVVYTPNDYWEFRLLFPKPRISRFVGAPLGVPTWLYAAGEYHVEAFEVNVDPINRSSRVQFEDWRVVGGARSEFGSVTAFLEAGWVFQREVEFEQAFGRDFEIDSGFIARAGFRY